MMREGKERYEVYRVKGLDWKTVLGRRKIRYDEILFSVNLYSERYNLSGVVDAIYRIGNIYRVLEIKNTSLYGDIPLDHLLQGVTYAVMVEDVWGVKIDRIDFYYIENDVYTSKPFNRYLKALWMRRYKRLIKVLYGLESPRVSRERAKCISCFYFKRFCLGYLE